MFKYIKTIHSSSPVETVCIPKSDNVFYSFGTLCQMSGGVLVNGCTAGKPTYLLLERNNSPEKNDTFKCLRVSSGMVFETTYENGDTPVIGDLVTYYANADEACVGVTSGGSVFEIADVRVDGSNTYVTVITI